MYTQIVGELVNYGARHRVEKVRRWEDGCTFGGQQRGHDGKWTPH